MLLIYIIIHNRVATTKEVVMAKKVMVCIDPDLFMLIKRHGMNSGKSVSFILNQAAFRFLKDSGDFVQGYLNVQKNISHIKQRGIRSYNPVLHDKELIGLDEKPTSPSF